MISEKDLEWYLEMIKDSFEFEYQLSELFDADIVIHDNVVDALIELLEKVFHDEDGWIDYYIFETDFGKEHRKITTDEGTTIQLGNVHDLYNLLIDGIVAKEFAGE